MSNGTTATDATSPTPQASSWFDNPFALAGVAALAGAALAGAIMYFASYETGDEPPIRVKNGSVELYLASSGEKWKQKSTTHWKISGGKRSKDPLDVTISTTATCDGGLTKTGSLVTLFYEKADGSTMTVSVGTDPDRPNQRHSAVVSSEPLTLSASDPKNRLLTYADNGGYIKGVSVDGTSLCTFTKATPLVTLMIADW